ncbi:Prolyl 3-hydroxylase 1 [Senna tora]|uniref:procollagen-proline 3-dioxygenase n=1 Tax=Senna tora TaxID=362788 RepID=A0A834W3W4_9FABA|nr:Prolyl 3-hydroxylase 1 [Senna tora]
MADPEHPRLIIRNFLSIDECKELEFIHKSCSTVGYRPNVFSTTLSHLIATNSFHLIIPFVRIRERLKDKLEEFFGCEYELFVEFTGLISWSRGASIGWHSDDNRPYLKQRDYAAVCYLNSYGRDFSGGLFHFQDGEPTSIMPMAGDVVMYTADCRNIHSVDEIIDGERLTLTLWFSRDSSHDEDAKLISLLSQNLLRDNKADSCLPLPASGNMYWFSVEQTSNEQLGFNICWARLHVLGYDTYISEADGCDSDVSELLVKPVQLVRNNEMLDLEFVNILHALQVVHFFCWKASALRTREVTRDIKVVELSDMQRQKINSLKSVVLNDHDLAASFFCSIPSKKSSCIRFDWTGIMAAVDAWGDYTSKLIEQIHLQLPHWRTHQSIYSVQLGE